MDFGTLPPEVNSAKMYSGPGAGSMLAAAAAWDGIADELYAMSGLCRSIISTLTAGTWLSAASASMAAATAPYLAWMNVTAAQAQQAAAQARAAATAFETAFAATVPPPLIAANRTLLMTLIAINVLGINTPAIATTETHYSEMWAQDAAMMYGYAGAAAIASTLTQFTSPAEVTDQAGLTGQAAARAPAALTQVTSTVPQALSPLSSPASSFASTMSSSISATSSLSSIVETLGPSSALVSTPVGSETETLGPVLRALTGGPASAASVEVGRAVPIGPLSVPQSWATAGVAPGPVTAALAGTGVGSAPVAPTSGAASMPGGLPIAGMAARGENNGVHGAVPRTGLRQIVMAPSAIG
jgi:PPE-repeat protein